MAPEENNDEVDSWLPKVTVTTMIALTGLGFTAFDLFLRYKSQTARSEKTETEYKAAVSFTPTDEKTESVPQYGME